VKKAAKGKEYWKMHCDVLWSRCWRNSTQCPEHVQSEQVFMCRGCTDQPARMDRTSVDTSDDARLELVYKFCYLGDMLSVDGHADAAMEVTVPKKENKFRLTAPLITNKSGSLLMRGKTYSSCV